MVEFRNKQTVDYGSATYNSENETIFTYHPSRFLFFAKQLYSAE